MAILSGMAVTSCAKQLNSACDVPTALHEGDLGAVRSYLRSTAATEWNCKGTPLLVTVVSADSSHALELAAWMLKQGADVNASTTDGATALHDAAGSADIALMSLLISAGANPNAADKLGNVPAHWLVSYSGPDRTAEGDINALELMRRAGADLSLRNQNADSVQSIAVASKKPKVAAWLASSGAPAENPSEPVLPSTESPDETSPLHSVR